MAAGNFGQAALTREASGRWGQQSGLLAGLAAALLAIAAYLQPDGVWLVPAAAGVTLLLLASGLMLSAQLRSGRQARALEAVKELLALEPVPAFVTRADGSFLWRNVEADVFYRDRPADRLPRLIAGMAATPEKTIADLQHRAQIYGHARETLRSRGRIVHISVLLGRGETFLWRIEDTQVPAPAGIDASPVPVLRLARNGEVLGCTAALETLLGKTPNSLEDILDEAAWEPGEVVDIMGKDGPVPMLLYEIDMGDLRDLFFLPLTPAMASAGDALFESLPVPLLKLDGEGIILAANRAARALLGEAEPAGRRLSELVSDLGRSVSDWLQEACAGRGLSRSEFLQVSKQPKDRFVQVTLKPLPEDEEARLMAVLNDATELKTLEAQFVQSQKMQAIGQLAGGVAHDFNNLLTAIAGHCDLLLLRHDQGDADYGDLVQIHQNANRAASLVGQLLAFSRKQTLQPEMVDLRDTLSELTHLLNRLVGERIALTLEHDRQLAPIRADKRQLEQVIMNLVVNARDAMPEGGEIRIKTEALSLDRKIRRNRVALPPGEYSVVKLIDQGVGIAPDKLNKIFEPFYTTKRTGEGTGLGLSTAYGIVKQTGGFIFVESELGEGTIFTLYFPALERPKSLEPEAEPVTADPSPPNKGEGVILLVEDEAPVRAFASRALRLRGYTVLEAESAEEALKTLGECDLDIDVFVTDVVMPGMDGPTWVTEALKERPGTRVVFVSGYAEEALADHKARIPNSVFLPKPFSLNDLTRTVQTQCNRRLH